MDQRYKEYLFRKNILVSEQAEEDGSSLDVLYALVKQFGIRVVSGGELATRDMLPFSESMLGIHVPEPFYRGFPQSVRALSPDQLLYDQLLHYTLTYGKGFFDREWHSMLETLIERTPLDENIPRKDFSIVTEADAEKLLRENVDNFLASSRPLSTDNYELVCAYLQDYAYQVQRCASKDTVVRLLADTGNLQFTDFLQMSDVMKLLEVLLEKKYPDQKPNKLNLRNRDRMLIGNVMNRLFEMHRCDLTTCYEKKAAWAGLLHHIHYEPVDDAGKTFTDAMRGKENKSVYAQFERRMAEQDILAAVNVLNSGKGSGALLRQVNYIASRCRSEEELAAVLDRIETKNAVILIQLLQRYANYEGDGGAARVFRFAKHNRLRTHVETEEEAKKRRSILSEDQTRILREFVTRKLTEILAGKLGRVYVDPKMERIALPLQESTTMSGYGVLPKGSRIPIEEGKVVRGFTYWEKVNDIDLSCFALDESCKNRIEFSWRTMYNKQSQAVCFSGDETSGFHGGSEYFDIDLEAARKEYPGMKYIIFCDNVYSGRPFASCICRAGYMIRDGLQSGEIYEPKTVRSSFVIDCNSTFAYLFAIDLDSREMIWLNVSRDSDARVAGMTDFRFLKPYLLSTGVINVRSFAGMLATELVDTPEKAEVIFSDETLTLAEGTEQIHSYDIDRLLKLMNS